jgi:hypothetical protein
MTRRLIGVIEWKQNTLVWTCLASQHFPLAEENVFAQLRLHNEFVISAIIVQIDSSP